MVCRNPFLVKDQHRSRRELLAVAERGLEEVRHKMEAGSLADCDAISKQADRILRRLKIARYFSLEIAQGRYAWSRKQEVID